MFGLFEENADPALARLEEAAGNPDCMQLADAAHALKSMAANLGASRLVSACANSRGCRADDEQIDVHEAIRLISDEIDAARNALERYIDAA